MVSVKSMIITDAKLLAPKISPVPEKINEDIWINKMAGTNVPYFPRSCSLERAFNWALVLYFFIKWNPFLTEYMVQSRAGYLLHFFKALQGIFKALAVDLLIHLIELLSKIFAIFGDGYYHVERYGQHDYRDRQT